ncbi:MAG: DMT family transporter [Aquificota bacterium]|nr:MAG: DMT family transporter [Aquificota bacterium]
MLGLFLAFLSSLFWATNDLLSKRLLVKGLDEDFTLWVRFPIAFLLLTPLGLYFWDFSLRVFTYSLLWLPLEVLGGLFFIRALKHAPLSLAMSFYSFMPVFSALFGWLLLREKPSLYGYTGVFLIMVASLLIAKFSPRELLKHRRGVFYMLLSAMCFGLNVVIGKLSVIESNAFFFSWYYTLLMSFGVLVFVKPKEVLNLQNYRHKEVPLVGLFFALGDLFYNIALLYTLSSYVASIERFSLLLTLIYAKVFFKERVENLTLPALLMVAGGFLLAFA